MAKRPHRITALGLLLPVLTASLLSACDQPMEPDDLSFRGEDIPGGSWPPTGPTYNTGWLGDTPLMRLLLPGHGGPARSDDAAIHDIEVYDQSGWVPGYLPVSEVTTEGGNLVLSTNGRSFSGNELLDARLWLNATHTHYITITEYSYDPIDGTHGYQFEHGVFNSFPMDPIICEPDEDGDRWAYVVGDVLVDTDTGELSDDPDSLLIACGSGALGKAITWGFAPWHPHFDDLSFYQTGVRTVRADYCGDGEAHTVDGTFIQVSNAWAGQGFIDQMTGTEAVFGPDGALCLSSPRIFGDAPGCALPACGNDLSAQALVTDDAHTWTKLAAAL